MKLRRSQRDQSVTEPDILKLELAPNSASLLCGNCSIMRCGLRETAQGAPFRLRQTAKPLHYEDSSTTKLLTMSATTAAESSQPGGSSQVGEVSRLVEAILILRIRT